MKHVYITPLEAAERLGVTPTRVRAMIRAGQLPARNHLGRWEIREHDLRLVAARNPKGGRPRKEPAQAKRQRPNRSEAS